MREVRATPPPVSFKANIIGEEPQTNCITGQEGEGWGGGLSEGETARVMRRESGIRFTAALDGETWICGNQLAARMINTCQLETVASSQCHIKWAAHSTLNQSDLFPFS